MAGMVASSPAITVTIDPKLLECPLCFKPLAPPIFQCTSGHITCDKCRIDLGFKCDRCPATPSRFRAMERIMGGLAMPCAFQENGCAETIPYAERPAHEHRCPHAQCHCPIPGCGPYVGASLHDHIKQEHPEIKRTSVKASDKLFPVKRRDGEAAGVVLLALGGDDFRAAFLVVVDRSVPSGRTVSAVQLRTVPLGQYEEEDFKYELKVYAPAGVLSLTGQTRCVWRLQEPYQASASLFVPDAMWIPKESPVYISLK